MKKLYVVLFSFIVMQSVFAVENVSQEKINPDLLSKYWEAKWIAWPHDSGLEYGVYHFRKNIVLKNTPADFIVHISADNRYQFYVNGERVCIGPSRGDLMHWHFESVDISEFLKQGENILSAVVWNFAHLKPWAQHSNRTGFILQGNSEQEKTVNTDHSWKVLKNEAYSAAGAGTETTQGQFVVVGPCDEVDAEKYPWDWEQLNYNDSDWEKAAELEPGKPKEAGTGIEWGLEPRSIPMMEAYKQQFDKIRRTENISVDENFLKGKSAVVIPANKTVVVLFDQGVLTTAYPQLIVSGGRGAKIELKYAEALFDENRRKGNRNEVEGKTMVGYADYFLPDGGENRLFRPLWLRTWRYLQLTVTTGNEALRLEEFNSEFMGYPFNENADFKSDDGELSRIWEVGWRTARLCAGETYYDCPYYEQLQYVGDTRIQALISLYVSGDDRLMRKAIQVYDDSRFSDGLTMSRYPSSLPQVIPPYSLFWVDMVHDYWMHRDDPEFVMSFLNGIDNVLHFFISKIDNETGLLGRTGYWNFVDWAKEWPWDSEKNIGGVPKGGFYGQSSILSLHLAYSAKHAADLHRWAGDEHRAEYYEDIAKNLIGAVKENCWDESRRYFANIPDKEEFSMHAQIFAVLTGAVPQNELSVFVNRFEKDESLIQPTMYFRFYLTQALKIAGLSDNYLATLDLWRDMLDLGLTTFAEKPDPTRSDCHAWSASPNYDFLATIAGIEPAEPGFKSVKIEPHFGPLNKIEGKMPHPQGTIFFQLEKEGEKGVKGEINLPTGLEGMFYWNGKSIEISGITTIFL